MGRGPLGRGSPRAGDPPGTPRAWVPLPSRRHCAEAVGRNSKTTPPTPHAHALAPRGNGVTVLAGPRPRAAAAPRPAPPCREYPRVPPTPTDACGSHTAPVSRGSGGDGCGDYGGTCRPEVPTRSPSRTSQPPPGEAPTPRRLGHAPQRPRRDPSATARCSSMAFVWAAAAAAACGRSRPKGALDAGAGLREPGEPPTRRRPCGDLPASNVSRTLRSRLGRGAEKSLAAVVTPGLCRGCAADHRPKGALHGGRTAENHLAGTGKR